LRTRKYLALLVLAAVLGVVISFLIYWFLKLIAGLQLPGILLASLASLGLGTVIGPETPTIAIGGRR
jgi:hypothetical protein